MKPTQFSFHVNVETNDRTGEIMAVYFQVRKGKSAKVKEYADGNVFADYSRSGKLLGFEMLAPCRAVVLDKIAGEAPARRFVRQTIPRAMLAKA
jgi:uncharacterized protein YuzE